MVGFSVDDFGIDDRIVVLRLGPRWVVGFDEDALAGAGFGGVDDVALLACLNRDGARRATWVIAHDTVLAHVRDAVLEEHEHVRAVVGAKSVASAEVLIDPDLHDVRCLRMGRPVRERRVACTRLGVSVSPTR